MQGAGTSSTFAKPTKLEDLPDDLHYKVIQMCPTLDKLIAGRVSQKFNKLVEESLAQEKPVPKLFHKATITRTPLPDDYDCTYSHCVSRFEIHPRLGHIAIYFDEEARLVFFDWSRQTPIPIETNSHIVKGGQLCMSPNGEFIFVWQDPTKFINGPFSGRLFQLDIQDPDTIGAKATLCSLVSFSIPSRGIRSRHSFAPQFIAQPGFSLDETEFWVSVMFEKQRQEDDLSPLIRVEYYHGSLNPNQEVQLDKEEIAIGAREMYGWDISIQGSREREFVTLNGAVIYLAGNPCGMHIFKMGHPEMVSVSDMAGMPMRGLELFEASRCGKFIVCVFENSGESSGSGKGKLAYWDFVNMRVHSVFELAELPDLMGLMGQMRGLRGQKTILPSAGHGSRVFFMDSLDNYVVPAILSWFVVDNASGQKFRVKPEDSDGLLQCQEYALTMDGEFVAICRGSGEEEDRDVLVEYVAVYVTATGQKVAEVALGDHWRDVEDLKLEKKGNNLVLRMKGRVVSFEEAEESWSLRCFLLEADKQKL